MRRCAGANVVVEPADGSVVGSRNDRRVDPDPDASQCAGDEPAVGEHDHPAGIEKDRAAGDPLGSPAVGSSRSRHVSDSSGCDE